MNATDHAGAAENVVTFPTPVKTRQIPSAPHVIVFRDGRMRIDPAVDGLWSDALPLIERICTRAGRSPVDIREAVGAMCILPVIVADRFGGIGAVALVNEGALPTGARVMYCAIEVDGMWPDLAMTLDFIDALAERQKAEAVILWSPSPLPPIGGWAFCDIPGMENESGLMRLVEAPGGAA